MNLEEIRSLPKRVLENLDDDIGNLNVYLVQDFNLRLLRSIVDFGLDIFGDLGMDEWALVPQIRHGNVLLLREEDKHRILGLAILMRDWEDADKCYLFDFAIAEELQGQGLGTHFLMAIIRSVEEQGFKRMSLTVDTENKPAVRLYRDKIGFEVDALSRDEYGKGHHRFMMELDFQEINEELLKI